MRVAIAPEKCEAATVRFGKGYAEYVKSYLAIQAESTWKS